MKFLKQLFCKHYLFEIIEMNSNGYTICRCIQCGKVKKVALK